MELLGLDVDNAMFHLLHFILFQISKIHSMLGKVYLVQNRNWQLQQLSSWFVQSICIGWFKFFLSCSLVSCRAHSKKKVWRGLGVERKNVLNFLWRTWKTWKAASASKNILICLFKPTPDSNFSPFLYNLVPVLANQKRGRFDGWLV